MTEHDLTTYVDHYLTLRAALGFRLQVERTLLYAFVRFVGDRCVQTPLRAQLAVEWACAAKNHGRQAAPAQPLSMVRQFLHYLRAYEPTTEVPSHQLIAAARRRTPYLLTPAHIRMLIDAARQAPSSRSLPPQTLTTLIGVLASTGIRIGEALRLTLGDVELDGETSRLLITQTKFQKSRWVPLHATTVAPLRTYARERAQRFAAHPTAPFFLSVTGTPVTHSAVLRWFTKTCRRLGIWPSGEGRRPCLHSLRHYVSSQTMSTTNTSTLIFLSNLRVGHDVVGTA